MTAGTYTHHSCLAAEVYTHAGQGGNQSKICRAGEGEGRVPGRGRQYATRDHTVRPKIHICRK